MNNKKLTYLLLAIALIIDIIIFGSVLYQNNKLKKKSIYLENKIIKLEERIMKQGSILVETQTNLSELMKEKEKQEKIEERNNDPYNVAVDNLDKTIFLTDINNYNPDSNETKISEKRAKEIAQYGFEESKKRIAGEGADNIENETVRIEKRVPNNYFSKHNYESYKINKNVERKCYVITRENEIGNGISVYVDVTTGLIIGGEAFGD